MSIGAPVLWLAALAAGCNDPGVKVYNSDPQATIVSHAQGDVVYENALVTLRGAVTDPDGDEVRVFWEVDGETICDTEEPVEAGEFSCETTFTTSPAEVILRAMDVLEYEATDKITLEVIPGDVPEVDILSPEEGVVYYTDELIAFEAEVSDGEDALEDLEIAWESALTGAIDVDTTPDSDGVVSGTAYLEEGEHEVTLYVTDTTGKTGTGTVVIEVDPPNESPTCSILSPADNTVGESGEAVDVEAEVDDAETPADQLEVTLASDKDGTLGTPTPSSDGSVSLSVTGLSEATHTLTLSVVDELGGTCTADVLYTVGTPPVVTLSSPADDEVYNEGETVRFSASVTDEDHEADEIEMSWSSDIDGEFSTEALDTSGNVSFTTSALSVGEHTITATATDPDGFYGRAVITLVINGLPSAPTVSISPDPAYTDSDLEVTFDAYASDPEGDSLGYDYAWYRDGSGSVVSSTDTLSSSETVRDETWTVVVTPYDDWGEGESGEASITISNTAPEVAVAITTTEPQEGEHDLLCEASSSDADGDALDLLFEWDVDGTAYTGATTTYEVGDTVPAEDTVAEEAWTCTVTPDDGTDEGTADSDTVYVLGQEIDWAHVQYPCSASIARSTGTLDVYVWVYEEDVTDDYGQGSGITVEVGLGADGSTADSSWDWFEAGYNTDQPAYGDASYDPEPYNNDEYVGTLEAPSTTGDYDYAARVSTDSGLSWVYVGVGTDCGGDGTSDSYTYDVSEAGDLEVYP